MTSTSYPGSATSVIATSAPVDGSNFSWMGPLRPILVLFIVSLSSEAIRPYVFSFTEEKDMTSRFSSATDALDALHAFGFLYPDATQGFQYDVVSAFKSTTDGQVTQGSLCGFNCRDHKGQYNCGMASSLNRGVSKSTFAPAEFILEKCAITEQGLDQVRQWFLDSRLDSFCDQFEIDDPSVRMALRYSFANRRTEANLFGGDPEQHPEIIRIIRSLKQMGMKVNLTATGGRWMNEPSYVKQLLADPPNVICVSLDDMTVLEFLQYSRMSPAELKVAYNAMDKAGDADYGQKKKTLAGFYVARYMSELPGGIPVPLLFNSVIGPGNILALPEITHLVEHTFKGSVLNPYPTQGSFNYESVEANQQYLQSLGHFVDSAIQKTLKGGRFVKRLHYWLILKAVFNRYQGDWPALARAMHGYGVWTCYEEAMAGFYVQPARSEVTQAPLIPVGKVVRRENVNGVPGGHLGCTWNTQTVTQLEQIHSPEQVAAHILGGMTLQATQSAARCEGCFMPRLMFNFVSSFLGLDPGLRHEVIMLRKQHVGF